MAATPGAERPGPATAVNRDPIFVNTNLLEPAARTCEERLSRDPADRGVLRSLAEIYRKMGRVEESAGLYERLADSDPDDEESRYLSAVLGGRTWPAAPMGVCGSPFVLIRDFLPTDFHAALLPFLMSVRDEFAPIVDGNNEYRPDSRQALEFRGQWARKRFQARLLEMLPEVSARLHLPPFTLKGIEIAVRAYQDGHFFGIHRDAPPNSPFADRLVNFVYYFHRVPRPYTGGELLLFDSDVPADVFTRSRFTRILPVDNTLVVFPCNFYHCVVPIVCRSADFGDSRFVINGHVCQTEGAA
jgi:Rps23 Pro-64 3,4-dihydroxylase Tpa1-like proline 4-hydroxylase